MMATSSTSPSLTLRILYTINSSPQYILARSSVKVPVSIVKQQYATTSFKACLKAISQTSPELIRDATRDFSIYVLDPLESLSAPPPVALSSDLSLVQTDQHPRGVAVGLGLMSWALAADEHGDDPASVTGTLIQVGSVQQLEIIFLLRETSAVPTLSFRRPWSPTVITDSKPVLAASKSASVDTHSAPERTHGPNADRSSSHASRTAMQPLSPISHLVESACVYLKTPPKKGRPAGSGNSRNKDKLKSTGTDKGKGKTKQTDAVKANPPVVAVASNEPPSVQLAQVPPPADTLSYPQPADVTTASLHHLLAAIANSVGAPKALGASNTAGTTDAVNPTATTNDTLAETSAGNEALAQALRELCAMAAATTQDDDSVSTAPNQRTEDEIVLLDKENVDPSVFRPRGPGDTKRRSSDPLARTGSLISAAPDKAGNGRKRTLSQCMDEKEIGLTANQKSRANPAGLRPRRWNANPPALLAPPLLPPTMMTSALAARGMLMSCPSSPPPPRKPWARAPPPTAASSPPRPPRYILPEWAKTDTALRPRPAFRPEGAAEINDKKKCAVKKGAKKDKNPSASASRSNKGKNASQGPEKPVDAPCNAANLGRPKAAALTTAPPPVFAADSCFSSLSSPPPPKTPPPGEQSFSLFTPARESYPQTPTPGSHANPLFTPAKFLPDSPTVDRRRVVLAPDSCEEKHGQGSEEPCGLPENHTKEEKLDSPSSLPTVLSHIETPDTTTFSGSSAVETSQASSPPHWSIGLPPSSPPPPSSPLPSPPREHESDPEGTTGGSHVQEQGTLTTDFDALEKAFLDLDPNAPQHSTDDLTICFDELNALFSDHDVANFLPTTLHSSNTSPPKSDLFLPCEDSSRLPGLDFINLCGTGGPSSESDMYASNGGVLNADMRGPSQGLGEIDHFKLAEELFAVLLPSLSAT